MRKNGGEAKTCSAREPFGACETGYEPYWKADSSGFVRRKAEVDAPF